MNIKLSIITINRNNAEGLKRTILNVINQKFTDYEYIIIDGNSTDDSIEIIKKYSEHVSFWVSEPDSGIYNAMNKGIKKAKGEYVIFMNSGDYFLNCDTLMNIFSKEHEADLIAGNLIKKWKRQNEKRTISPKITFYNFMSGSTPHHQATFTKRSLFDEIGFYDEELKISSDWKFFLLAIFKYDRSIEVIDEYIAVMDTCGISNSKIGITSMAKEQDETFRTYFPYFYEDYYELYRLKRFTFARLKKHIKWRLQFILRG